MNNKNGMFITFEGPDGAGKTTQLQRLAQYLDKELKLPIVVTREPGGTVISDKIREILLDPENKKMVAETEVLLYAASRAQHVREKIIPALEEGKIVLCDRFIDASVAYQGYGNGVSVQKILEINQFATGGVSPDRTYLLDLPESAGRERIMKRNRQDNQMGMDRIEQKELDYHKKVRQGFQEITANSGERIVMVNADKPETEIHQYIIQDFIRFYKTVSDV